MVFNEIALLIKLFVGALGTFCGILVWSKTREIAWIFIVLGILLYYVLIVLETLTGFGILSESVFLIRNEPVLKVVLENLPMLCFIIGMIAFAVRKRI